VDTASEILIMLAKIIRHRAFRSCHEALVFLRGPDRMVTFKCGLPSGHVGSHLAMGIEGGSTWTLLWYPSKTEGASLTD